MRRTALALVAALTAACGAAPSGSQSGSQPSSPPAAPSLPAAPPVAGMDAEVVLLRTDEAIGGQVQVRITNTGDAPFTVTAVALHSAGFRAQPATAVQAEFAPGRTIDLPTPYGAPICSGAPLPAVAKITVARPGRAAEHLRLPLSAEVLQRLHDKECAALAVLEVVDIAVTGLREEGDVVRGALRLTRRAGGEPVTVSRVGGSVLIDVAADELPVEMVDRAPASTPVTFRPATCDPHVLSEAKKPYVFPLHVAVGDGAPVPLGLPLSQAARSLLDSLVQQVCAPG